jgi:D-alanine-D-alanine ligase
MRIGMTYDLRDDWIALGLDVEDAAEYDSIATIDALDDALRSLGHETDRIGNLRALLRRLGCGDRWDLVFNIAEGRGGFGREAQVPALLDAFEQPYVFADPLACCVTLHKATAKRVLRDVGVPTPAFALVETEDDIAAIDLPMPLFCKPVAEGTSKGIGADARVESRAELDALCRRLLDRYRQPVLVEEFLPGHEVTVGVLGTGPRARVVGVLDVVLRDGADRGIYTFRNKEECERLVEYRLADPATSAAAAPAALAAWRALGGRDGGRVDLRASADGRFQVMELNPLPGLHPTHSDLPILCDLAGIGYRELIDAIVASAVERIPQTKARTCVS